MGFLMEKIVTYFGNHPNLFSFTYAYIVAIVSASRADRQPPNKPPPCLVTPLADHSGYMAEEGDTYDCESPTREIKH